jgi:methionine-rich copper-binding protein CopC
MPSARIRAAVLGLAVPAVLALTAAPAAAHNELLSSTPKQGAQLTSLPAAIELKFGEAADARFVKIAATGPDGSSVAAGKPTVTGTVVSQPLTPGTASGTYTVAYRVVSKDGHPVSGKVTFTATLQVPTVATSPSTAPAEVAAAPKKAAATQEGEGNGWMLYAAIGAGVLLLGALALGLRSRASRTG